MTRTATQSDRQGSQPAGRCPTDHKTRVRAGARGRPGNGPTAGSTRAFTAVVNMGRVVKVVGGWVQRWTHVPAGVALILAAVFVPKLVILATVLWSVAAAWLHRRWGREDE